MTKTVNTSSEVQKSIPSTINLEAITAIENGQLSKDDSSMLEMGFQDEEKLKSKKEKHD